MKRKGQIISFAVLLMSAKNILLFIMLISNFAAIIKETQGLMTFQRISKYLLCSLLSSILFFACAKQGFPPGGPIDKKPPYVEETFPLPGSINVAIDTKIEFKFSEAVDHRSCEESIFITPFPGENVKYKWRGKKLRIQIPGGLRANRTYVITIGTGTRDRRNNRMKTSFSLAFSTGSELDQGFIAGKIYGEGNVEGTQVWAYDLSETPEPDPAQIPPLYITQAGEQGDFRLSFLAISRYRVFAIVDRDMNGLYTPQYDAIGVAHRDIALTDSLYQAGNIFFRTSVRDTTPPLLSAAMAPDQHHVDLRFSEPLSPDHLSDPANYLITSDEDTLAIVDAFQDERNAAYVHLTTETQQSVQYGVQVLKAFDLAGFALGADSAEVTFQGSAVPDSNKPYYLFMIPADSSKMVPLNTSVELFFSETMKRETVEKGFSLSDTVGHRVSGEFSWPNGAHLVFVPDDTLARETFYLVTLPVDSVYDLFGNPLADTLFEKRFTTLNPDTLSAISGQIVDQDTTAIGPFHLRAVATNGTEYELWLPEEGIYHFNNILPGIYNIEIYRDEDKNGQYTFGEPFPFQPAERFYIYADSINVRSRWPNEGNDILFPR